MYWNFQRHNHRFAIPTRQSPKLLERTGLRYVVFQIVKQRIYECHIGMAGEEPGVSTYSYFEYSVLPRVIKDGYNCVYAESRNHY